MKTYTCNIAGVTFSKRQSYIYYIIKQTGAFLICRREKHNRFDKNAIKVIGKADGGKYVQLGYLPKEIAEQIAPLMDNGYKTKITNFEITGGPPVNYGIKINLCVYKPYNQKLYNHHYLQKEKL